MKSLFEITTAVDAGKTVRWVNSGYRVIKNPRGEYLIKCVNGSCLGLTWLDGTTLNGKLEDFYLEGSPEDPTRRATW